MASPTSLASLLQQASLNDHEEILKTANDVLKKNKADPLAQRVRLVALIKLDRYEDALRTVDEGGDSLRKEAPLETAYILYKNGKYEGDAGATQVLSKFHKNDRGAKHLQAQLHYRLETFASAEEIYSGLTKTSIGKYANEKNDLRINSLATDAQQVWTANGDVTKNFKPTRQDLDQYETVFNTACGYIARGEIKQADILLRRAKDLCDASDDLSEEEKKAELLQISVQQLYVLSRLKRFQDAASLSSDISVQKISDTSTQHIARNNILSVEKRATSNISSNPYLEHRLLQATSQHLSHGQEPFKMQEITLRQNSWVSAIQAGKFKGVAESTASFIAALPPSISNMEAEAVSPGVVNAAASARLSTGKLALKQLLPLLETRPHDVGLLLTIVHLYLLTNNLGTATALIEKFLRSIETKNPKGNWQQSRFVPGIVALLVVLYTQQNRNSEARKELANSASYWLENSRALEHEHSWQQGTTPKAQAIRELLKSAGAMILLSRDLDRKENGSEHLQLAENIFKEYINHFPEDRVAVAGLAATSSEAGKPSASSLPPISKLTDGVLVSELEAAGIPKPPASGRPAAPTESKKRAATRDAAGAPKRIRPSRLPKNYEASKTPDPERWIPLRDRSYYKPKKKKGRQQGGGGGERGGQTQGGMPVRDDTGSGSRPSTPSAPQAGGASTKGAKKKKGKK